MPDSLGAGGSADLGTPRSWGVITLVWLLLSAAAPPTYFSLFGHVPPRIILAGAVTWALAIAAKHPLALLLNRMLGQSNRPVLLAGLQGLLSAVLELTAAGAYLHYVPEAFTGLNRILAFGSAAGSAEVVYVLAAGVRGGSDPAKVAEWHRWAVNSVCVRYQVPLERFFALVGHTGARGMVYLGLHLPGMTGVSFCVAVLTTFSAVDGVAYYGHLRNWNWLNAAVCRRVHPFFSMVSVLELVVFLIGFQMLE